MYFVAEIHGVAQFDSNFIGRCVSCGNNWTVGCFAHIWLAPTHPQISQPENNRIIPPAPAEA
jgi:hypothetical protein